jgi:hypothetical protein
MHTFYSRRTDQTSRPPHHDPEARALLNRIRFTAASCRASSRLDLFEARTVLDAHGKQDDEAHVAALIRVLGEALGARPVFRRTGEEDLSFDEAWLVAAVSARAKGDDASFLFLVTRRVLASKRRSFAMLVTRLTQRLATAASPMDIDENLTRTPTQAEASC